MANATTANQRKDARDHGNTVASAGRLHNLVLFTERLNFAYAFRGCARVTVPVSSTAALVSLARKIGRSNLTILKSSMSPVHLC